METLIYDILFIGCSITAILLALMVVVFRNPVHCSFFLVGSFIPLAVLYFLLYAPFIGIIQILVYAGAIMVLFTFVIMMIDMTKTEYTKQKSLPYRITAFILTGLFIVMSMVPIVYWNSLSASDVMKQQVVNTTEPTERLSQGDLKENFGSVTNLGYLIFNGDKFDRYAMAQLKADEKKLKRQSNTDPKRLAEQKERIKQDQKLLEASVRVEDNIFLLSFELVSILILIAIMGVLIIGKRSIHNSKYSSKPTPSQQEEETNSVQSRQEA